MSPDVNGMHFRAGYKGDVDRTFCNHTNNNLGYYNFIEGIQPLPKPRTESTMKIIKTLAAVAAFSVISFGSYAQSVTATGATLDSTEAKIAVKAHEEGASYKITQAYTNNGVHMTAELYK